MSRGEFRARLDSPRPRAAVAMVAAANGTLAVTGQVQPWIWALQVAVLVCAAWRQERPFRWQRNPWVLNLGLGGAVALAVGAALDGAPATVALARFAAIASGLQLLDARPRRSEFLLVALSLFQVVVASSLTDSVLFPLLVVVFLLTTVWTLLLHTLRVEAAEANESHALAQVITPGLARMTALASALSLVLAGLLFLLLPRLHSGVGIGGGLLASQSMSGFSDQVQLGDLGRIRSDPTVVLRVETLAGPLLAPEQAYWRGIAFDHFDGARWSVTPRERIAVPGRMELGLDLGAPPPEAERLRHRIVRDPVASGVLFRVGEPSLLQDGPGRVQRDVNGALYGMDGLHHRIVYTVESALPRRDASALRADRAAPPGDGRALQLPDLGEEVAALARRVTASARSDAERAFALERHLRETGRYSDVPPSVDPADPRTPVEVFLHGDLAGHCEYFATSMVVLARSLGLPARLVNGFAGGRANRIGGFVELARADAHAWVEIHFERAGWVRFDPTPPDLRGAAGATLSWTRASELWSAVEHLWYRRVVEFDAATQIRGLHGAWMAWRSLRDANATPGPAPGARSEPGLLGDPRLALAALALALGAALVWRWRRGAGEARALPPAYARALRLLARRGLVREPAETARDFAAKAAHALPPEGARAFARLTEAYLGVRWGDRTAAPEAADCRRLRDSLTG